eukprot:79903_1
MAAPIAWPINPQIKQNIAPNINGINIHYLACGNPSNPLLLLLHGFPEIAFSWRKIMIPLSEAGYYVVAPDRRGHGQTTNSDNSKWNDYNKDINELRTFNQIRDMLGLLNFLRFDKCYSVIGHDAGSPIAGWCAMVRPDVFQSVILMSACYTTPKNVYVSERAHAIFEQLFANLKKISSRPRRHYFDYHASPEANDEIMKCPGGLETYFRAYYHMKSADWEGNKNVYNLGPFEANSFAKLPRYYVMDLGTSMPETVLKHMPSNQFIKNISSKWLSDNDVKVYANEYRRTTFQGGLNGYRYIIGTSRGAYQEPEKEAFVGKTILVPSAFISGANDWGPRQIPGSFETMTERTCKGIVVRFVQGAGHWVQQEQPEQVVKNILNFFMQKKNLIGRRKAKL